MINFEQDKLFRRKVQVFDRRWGYCSRPGYLWRVMRSDQPQSGGRFSSGVIIPIQGDIQAKDLSYNAFILARGMLLCKLPPPPPKVKPWYSNQ